MNQSAQENLEISSKSYKETPYEDSQYEIVGTPPAEQVFLPLKIEVKNTNVAKINPMFENYGGVELGEETSRWHLPEGVRHVSTESKVNVAHKEAEEKNLIELKINESYDRGFLEGETKAKEESQQIIEQQNQMMNARMNELLRDLSKQLQEKIQLIEKRSIQVALSITEKLIPHAVEINPEYILEIIRESIGLAGASIIQKVRVSPEDKEFIDVIGLQKSLKEYDGSWEFVADETIRAGCITETSAGEIEYDLIKAWERIKDQVMKVV